MDLPPKDPRHGTMNAYVNHRCRCDLCKKAMAGYYRKRRKELKKQKLSDEDPRHGTSNGYTYYGCRCTRCTKANNESSTRWSHRKKKQYEDDIARYKKIIEEQRKIIEDLS